MAERPALPGPRRATPSRSSGPRRTQRGRSRPGASRAEPNGGGPSRAEPNGGGEGREREIGEARFGSAQFGASRSRGRARVSAMRRGRWVLRVLLLLLRPVPGWGWGCGSGRLTAAGGCCTPCPPGFGVTEPCAHTDTRCQPCTHNEDLEPVTGDPSTPGFVPPPPEATGKDIIPVYCSLLAAVVVGLLAYVAFKCWHTCRQKQQLAKARAGDLGTSPEGEKLQSDSGVFLDTPNLQEPHQAGKAPHPEGHPLSGVPAQRQEELERLLESGGPGGDWRSLAARLGFGPAAIGTFGRGRAPTRTLLSTWAGAEGATLETLCQALVAIGQQDAARRLVGSGDVTSAV
ncbi:death domain-containing membrane protein NRADD-like [Cariama cristata]